MVPIVVAAYIWFACGKKKVYLRLLEAPIVFIVIVVFDVVVHIVISIDLVVVLVVISKHIIHSWGN